MSAPLQRAVGEQGAPTAGAIAIQSIKGSGRVNDDVARVVHPSKDDVICLLADGLGGHAAGAVAANIAIDTIEQSIGDQPVERAKLVDYVAVANAAIVAAQRRSLRQRSMRTTLALMHTDHASVWWLHCGDTRVYHYRGQKLLERTLDHSVAQMQSGGEGAEQRLSVNVEDRHRLLRVLGGLNERESRPRVTREAVKLCRGDRFVLCTDGWWERVDMDLAGKSDEFDPAKWLQLQWQEASHAGVPPEDDATAIAISFAP